MRLFIFHHHLNPGGVTRIIESQIESLKDQSSFSEIKVITGHIDDPHKLHASGVITITEPLFNYLAFDSKDLDKRLDEIRRIFRSIISKEDIIHAHNINLGKNPLVTIVLSEMAQDGFKLVNHAHDFAEDRKVNYQFIKQIMVDKFGYEVQKILYPGLPNYHFATLNSYDRERLINYGIGSERITLLPNPVVFKSGKNSSDKTKYKTKICQELGIDPVKKLVTYPVRVIRRKNIGEFILLGLLFKDQANFIVTQPPLNPVEIEPYLKWKNFCQKNGINIIWEAGKKVDFEELIIASDFCITTSIQEGFGMVYLEPWLLGTPVIGRNIEMVTSDIIAGGIKFPILYNELQTPNDLKNVDFGGLNMDEQMSIIEESISDSDFAEGIFSRNSFLNGLLKELDNNVIEKNKTVILKNYSLNKYGDRLNGIYQRLVGQS